MEWNAWISALAGGVLIGLAATLMLAMDGKIMGVSGIVGGLIDHKLKDRPWRWSFVLGILSMGILFNLTHEEFFGSSPAQPALLIAAGLAVGFGTRLGNGCTSGHGICGLSRLSIRSLVATLSFMAAGIITVWLVYA